MALGVGGSAPPSPPALNVPPENPSPPPPRPKKPHLNSPNTTHQPPVLELLQLERVALGAALAAHAHRVERAARVDALLRLGAAALRLGRGHGDELDAQEGVEVEGDGHAEPRGVAALLERPKRGVVPVAEAEDLDREGPGDAEHGPAAVDDLALAEAGQGRRLAGEVERVEAVVADEVGGREVGGRLRAGQPVAGTLAGARGDRGAGGGRAAGDGAGGGGRRGAEHEGHFVLLLCCVSAVVFFWGAAAAAAAGGANEAAVVVFFGGGWGEGCVIGGA